MDNGGHAGQKRTMSSEESQQENEKLRRLLRERDETIKDKDEKIKEIIKDKDEIIKDKDERLNECKETSLQKLLLLEDSKHLGVKITGSDSSNVQNNHCEASANEMPFELSKIEQSNLREKHQSRLLLDFNKGQCSVTTEADVVSLIRSALVDALELLAVTHDLKLDVRMERSFLSCRPDILVVNSHRYNIPLLAIEVKKEALGLFTKEKVLGQVFDYASMLAAFGHKVPFVILSTFTQSCVCWLVNSEATKLASSINDRYASANSTPSKRTDGNEKTESPPTLKAASTDSDDSKANEFYIQGDRTLNRSKIYSAHELVPLVYSSILCALKGFRENPPTEIRLLIKGKRIKVPAIRMTAETYTWGMLETTVGASITSRNHPSKRSERINKQKDRLDSHDDKAYYVIGDVGQGVTSKAFHALDASGEEVVLKMFVKTTNKEGDTLDLNAFNVLAKQKTAQELTNLKKLYPSLQSKFHNIVLNKFHCIVMPFFEPVKKQDREGALDGIKSVLDKQFAPLNLMYEDDDVRWRHVGTRDREYVLFDVADLAEAVATNFVDDHINKLRERMPESEGIARDFVLMGEAVVGGAEAGEERIGINRTAASSLNDDSE